jgi:hypothetical protein
LAAGRETLRERVPGAAAVGAAVERVRQLALAVDAHRDDDFGIRDGEVDEQHTISLRCR